VFLRACVCCRRWLPRTKLDPLGVDSELDGVKLTANNKANVCAAVQRAYDRARELTGSVGTIVTSADTDAQPSNSTA